MFRPTRKKTDNIGGTESLYYSTDHEDQVNNNSGQTDAELSNSSNNNHKSNVQRLRKKTMEATTTTTPSLLKRTYAPTRKSTLIIPYLVGILFFDGILLSSFGWKSIVFSIPVMLAGWVVIMIDGDRRGGEVQLHTRIIALAFVSAIVCAQFPSYVSKALGSMTVTLFGLGTIHDRQLSGNGNPPTITKDNMSQNEQSRKAPYAKHNDTNEDDDDKHHGHPSQYQKRKWSGPMKTFMATLGVTCSLLTENFFIWVVSATFYPSHNPNTTPPALQDNGRIILTWIFRNIFSLSIRDVQQLRRLFNVQWGLVAAFGATLVCCEIGLVAPTKSKTRTRIRTRVRTLWSVALRALLTLATARAIRTISFLLTVLPSQVSNCYTQHFPNPPPSNWYDWLMIGILPNSHGGCNDLIISGHATVTSTLACASTSVASNTKFSVALWALVAMDYSIEVYEGFHYSVDMWMGALLTSLLWRIYVTLEQDDQDEQVEKDDDDNNKEEEGNVNDSHTDTPVQWRSLAEVTTQQLLWYGLPGFGAFVVVAVMPEAIANYWILVYFCCAATNTAKNGLNHYTQHLLILLLFIALAIYL